MKRNYGIDLLRMVLMLMVVILHILGHGGVLKATQPLTVQYNVSWLIECLAFCAVNCFVLISGYVHYGRKYKIVPLLEIYLQALLYSLGIAVCVWILKPESFSLQRLTDFLFPVSKSAYWYVSAYFGLSLFIPLLNAGIRELSEKTAKLMVCMLFLLFSILPTIAQKDAFSMNFGYSVFWFIFMYIIGACIKKHGWGDKLSSWKAFLIYILSALISWGFKIGYESTTAAIQGTLKTGLHLIDYTAPTMVIAAVALLISFKNMTVPAKATKVICLFSPAAFGVYLIHDHIYTRQYLIANRFTFLAEQSVPIMVAGIFISALAVFALCILMDWVRHRLFQWIRIRVVLDKLENQCIRRYFGAKQ